MRRTTAPTHSYLRIAKARSKRVRGERPGDGGTWTSAKDADDKPLQGERWRVYVAYMVPSFIFTTVVVLSLLAGVLVLLGAVGGDPPLGV
ncbi:MAG: hypothetical protein WB771_10895 [Solirubrobacterales bacterium]